MRYYFRCEDKYGVASLVKSVLDKSDLEYMLTDDLGICDCLRFTYREVEIVDCYKPDLIVNICDVDSPGHRAILGDDEASELLHKYNKVCKIPTVFAAETIMLYQFLNRLHVEDTIDQLVHKKNTAKLHLTLLAILCGAEKLSDVKKVDEYLDIEKLRAALRGNVKYNNCLEELLCSLSVSGLEESSYLQFLRDLNTAYKKLLNVEKKYTVDDVELTTFENLYDKRSLFKTFPRRFK